MSARTGWTVVGTLFLVIVVMLVVLFVTPKPVEAPTTPITPTSSVPIVPSGPLHTRVIVKSPTSGGVVGQTFAVTGEAPGNWYFEASFPIQVRDVNNEKIGQAIAQAQSDWMTTAQVPFTATITLSSSYTGPATLVLIKDNPSGLPEHDDALEIPIVVQ